MYINPRLHKPLIAFGGLVAGAAAGWTGSYFRTRKMTAYHLETIAAMLEENRVLKEEVEPKIRELRDELRRRTEAIDSVTELVDEATQKIMEHPSSENWEPAPLPFEPIEDVAVTPPLELVKNVFPDEDDKPEEWNQEAEDAARQSFPGRPYIISYAEFAENSFGFNQQTLTFYEGDEVLTDPNDVVIYAPGEVVGPLVFGKGSGDPNICYVRNKKLKVEYEVIRDPGHYAMVRQGLDIEEQYEEGDIKHSAILRMRRED